MSATPKKRSTLQRVEFVVDRTPYTCWEWDLPKHNLSFLQGLDSDYFIYVAQSNVANLDGDNKHLAALAIRIAYSQALETLFALLCSVVQAPDCTVGWMLAYRPFELRHLVECISQGRAVLTRLPKPPSWQYLAEVTHSAIDAPPEKRAWIVESTSRLWDRFAREFLSEVVTSEYNSAKHGLRTRLGGFSFLYKKGPTAPNEPLDLKSMTPLVGSQFGSAFFTPVRLGDKHNFRALNNGHNWSPQELANRLVLLAWSINNIVSALRMRNGEVPMQCPFIVPDAPEDFDSAFRRLLGTNWVNHGIELTAEHIQPRQLADILRSYDHAPKDGRRE